MNTLVPLVIFSPGRGENVRTRYARLAARPMMLALLCALSTQVLQGCGSGTEPQLAQAPPPPVVPGGQGAPQSTKGHFRGSVNIGADMFHAEAIITEDGWFRLYVGGDMTFNSGPLTGAGITGDLLQPAASTQVFGQLGANGNEHLGTGIVAGQICPATAAGRFCDATDEVEIEITDLTGGYLKGDIRIQGSAAQETWAFDLGAWSIYFRSAGAMDGPAGSFKEELAPFVQGNDVITTIDAAGRLFFQDAASGCTGNGTLTPHLDGKYYVYDVTLTIENCGADYGYLNSLDYVGLATETQNNYWGYDSWLLVIAAVPAGASPAAVTLYARRF